MRKLSSLTLPWPTDWAALFGARRPLIVELGFGYGAFLLHLARQHPDANVIGVEIANRCLAHVEARIAREGWPNVRVIHSTAETALHHLFEPASVWQVHINFPDPWFKKRHGHRRLMQRDTLDAMVNRLQPGGELYLATDILEYAELSAALLAETIGLENRLSTPWAAELPGRAVTRYEGKAQREGRPCYYFVYRRTATPAPPLPVVQELPMPHLVFRSPLSLDDIQAQFAPTQHTVGSVHISLLEAYRGRHKLLFEVFVKELTIEQHFAFTLAGRPQAGEYTLQLGTLGHARPTEGVHLAAGLLGDWLMSLHPDNRELKRKLKE